MNAYELILGIVTLVFSAIITPLMIYYLNKKSNEKVDVVEKKLDANHEQQNGNLTKLLETTKELATANEKAKHKKV